MPYVKPNEIIAFEPHHVSFARIGTSWFGIGARNWENCVIIGAVPVDIERERKFYLSNGAKEEQVFMRP